MTKQITFIATIATLLLMLVISVMQRPASAAPNLAVLTPVANNNGSGQEPRFAQFFSGTPISSDTRVCAQLGGYNAADFQFKVVQTGANTITLKHQYSNNNADFIDGTSFMSGTPVPAQTPFGNMAQHALFGRYTCVFADLDNTTPVSVYVSAQAK